MNIGRGRMSVINSIFRPKIYEVARRSNDVSRARGGRRIIRPTSTSVPPNNFAPRGPSIFLGSRDVAVANDSAESAIGDQNGRPSFEYRLFFHLGFDGDAKILPEEFRGDVGTVVNCIEETLRRGCGEGLFETAQGLESFQYGNCFSKKGENGVEVVFSVDGEEKTAILWGVVLNGEYERIARRIR